METLIRLLPWALALLALLSGTDSASAYYDPGVQRWINRDPITEDGFRILRSDMARIGVVWERNHPNRYDFVHNKATSALDADGLTLWKFAKCVAGCWNQHTKDIIACGGIGLCAFVGGSASCAAVCRFGPPSLCAPCMTIALGVSGGFTVVCLLEADLKLDKCEWNCLLWEL